MDNTECFTMIKELLQKHGVSDSMQTSSNQYRSSRALAVMNNIETTYHQKIVAAENVGFIFEAELFQISTDDTRLMCHKKMVVAENVVFIFKAELFKSVPMILGLAAMDNSETFHNKKIVATETIGFRFEAGPVKSVPMILGFGCHGQH